MHPGTLGGFEELVLLAVAGLGDKAYGVTVRERLEDETGRRVSVGSVYATLDRLHRKKLVTSRMGPATPERGGRRKRLYGITALGARVLRDRDRIRATLWDAAGLPARS